MINARELEISKTLGRKILQWHNGQNDPLYAIGSCSLAGEFSKKETVQDAIYNLQLEKATPEERKLAEQIQRVFEIHTKKLAGEIANEIRQIRYHLSFDENTEEEERYCDIRLQVYENGDWAIRSGSSDYDQDHNGFWGCSSITPRSTNKTIMEIAFDLIDQAEESMVV